ncbi:hypothetical protein [Enhygromyxa salina]|uniref:hypothetical protein n=1 Tax=Enhygromyxa salina TaxID=215803 RepID=UPI0004E71192|nr:hypothetical protein [Enhygromyxa salina]
MFERALTCLLGLSLVTGLGCSAKEAEPVSVARSFADTARRGDVDGMLAVIEAPAVQRLELEAEHASDHVGGRRSIEAAEMLQIVGVDRSVAVAGAELLDDDGKQAHVELTMTDGRTLRLELVWEEPELLDDPAVDNPARLGRPGGWKVRIPLPSDQTSAADELATGAAPPDA